MAAPCGTSSFRTGPPPLYSPFPIACMDGSAVLHLARYARIALTSSSTCGVTTDGRAFCWGSDTYGQLGDGGAISYSTADVSLAPVQVAGGATYAEVSTGDRFS